MLWLRCLCFTSQDRQGTPSPMMARSFLYKLHSHKLKPGVQADPNRYEILFTFDTSSKVFAEKLGII